MINDDSGAPPQNTHRIWSPVRQNAADTHLLGLIATYGATVILVRIYLEMTGYPQIGDGTFHIAHLLWGGLCMFVAVILLLVWANPWLLSVTAVLGGIGAGLFIDEVGKFITQKNDYFFPLAFPIIYAVTLVGVWLYFRVHRSLPRNARTLLYHALFDLKKILDDDLDPFELQQLVQTLQQAIATAQDPAQKKLAQNLLDYVQSRDIPVERNLHWSERLVLRGRDWLAHHPPRPVLKGLLVVGLVVVALLAALKLYALLVIVQAAQLDLTSALSNYVIVNGKSSYVVHNPFLILLQSLFVLVTGALAFASAVLLGMGSRHDPFGLRLGVLGLVLSLTVVDLITFYFNQLYTIEDAALQLAVLGLAQLYRWRFVLGKAVLEAPAFPDAGNALTAGH